MGTAILELKNATIVMIKPTMENKKNGESSRFRQFAVRLDYNYTDVDETTRKEIVVEKQPLDMYCTTFDLNIIKSLDQAKVGDKVHLKGFVRPSWRGFKANNTIEGLRFVIPDIGEDPIVVDSTLTIYPTNRPYDLDKKAANHIIYPTMQLIVNQFRLTTDPPELTNDNPYWQDISEWYREQKNWTCEQCYINLKNVTRFLDTHHIRGRAYNSPEDLKALCVQCHSEEKQPKDHGYMKNSPRYKQFLEWKKR